MVRPLFFMFFLKNGFSCCNRLIITWELLVVGLGQWAQEGRRRKNSPGWQVEGILSLVLTESPRVSPAGSQPSLPAAEGPGGACNHGSPGGSFSWVLSQIWGSQPGRFSWCYSAAREPGERETPSGQVMGQEEGATTVSHKCYRERRHVLPPCLWQASGNLFCEILPLENYSGNEFQKWSLMVSKRVYDSNVNEPA